jgi:hypothetical protein
MTTKLRAQFDGKALIPLGPVDLPTGQVLDVEVHEPQPALDDETRPGSPKAILKVLQSLQPISAEDAAELERLIEEGQLPVDWKGAFDDEKE